MTDPAYANPALLDAATKINAIVEALPEELQFKTLYYIQFLSDMFELKSKEKPEEKDSSILNYASVKGREEAEAYVNQQIALATMHQKDGLEQLELLYKNWRNLKSKFDQQGDTNIPG